MVKDTSEINDCCEATVNRCADSNDFMELKGHYDVECRDSEGILKWWDTIENTIMTLGKNLTLDTILGNVAAGAVVMGLKGTGTAQASDTQALHGTWLEVGLANAPTYTGNRKTPVFGAAAAGVKSTSSVVVFAMTSSGTIAGCFINIGGSATVDNTTGTLFSAGDFTLGNKIVTNGDQLSVSYSLTNT